MAFVMQKAIKAQTGRDSNLYFIPSVSFLLRGSVITKKQKANIAVWPKAYKYFSRAKLLPAPTIAAAAKPGSSSVLEALKMTNTISTIGKTV